MFKFPFRPSVAVLSRSALAYNLKKIDARLQQQTPLHQAGAEMMAVVKADAYGHGIRQMGSELWKRQQKRFCVASLEEGIELRSVLPKAQILVLGGTLHWDRASVELAQKYKFELGVNDLPSLKRLAKEDGIKLHLKFDTGMNRLGLKSEDWGEAFRFLLNTKAKLEGFYTHFAGFSGSSFLRQVQLFNEAVRWADSLAIRPRWIHCENSGALFSRERLKKGILSERCNLVRPGIAMYGYMPKNFNHNISLHPVLELRSEISLVKNLQVGEGISYDHLYRAKKTHSYGVVPMGYADGIAKEYSQVLEPLWYDKRGRRKGRLKVCGAICMDMIMLRSQRGQLEVGDWVLFWGNFPNSMMKKKLVDPYELNLRIIKRIPRLWAK